MKYLLRDSGQEEININVSHTGNKLKFCEGLPCDDKVTMGNLYVQFIYAHHLVKVWLNDELKPADPRIINRYVLNYVGSVTRA